MNQPTDKFTKFGFDTDFFEISGVPQSGRPAPSQASPVFATPTPAVASTVAEGSDKKAPRNVKEALEAGYAEGFAAAMAQAEATFTRELEQLHHTNASAINTLELAASQAAEELTRQNMSLLRATLHRFIGHAAENYPDQILEAHLKDLVANLSVQENLTLRIAPAARAFHEKLGLTHASIQGLPFYIKEDSSLKPTDCVAEWKRGGVEAKIDLHLAQLDTLLAGAGAVLTQMPKPLPAATPPLPRADGSPPVGGGTPAGAAPTQPTAAQQLMGDDDELIDALK